jgi:hypothetical protein
MCITYKKTAERTERAQHASVPAQAFPQTKREQGQMTHAPEQPRVVATPGILPFPEDALRLPRTTSPPTDTSPHRGGASGVARCGARRNSARQKKKSV